MDDLSKAFVEQMKDKHNGLWVLFFCNNTATYDRDVLKLFLQRLKLLYFMSRLTLQNVCSQ